jgi:hypothetical protein
MAPNLLKTYHVPIDLSRFLELCWDNVTFYEHFLVHKLQDVGVNVGEWTASDDNSHMKSRNVKCFHPSKISFPGLPSHAEVKQMLPLLFAFPNNFCSIVVFKSSNARSVSSFSRK